MSGREPFPGEDAAGGGSAPPGTLATMGKVMTVRGAIEPEALGVTLVHEHVMSTFGGDPARYPGYDVDALLETVLPYLAYLKGLGCQAIADGTAAYFGRHPGLLKRISEESGLHILTNTGYYGAANDRYVPPHAYRETADEVAARWVREWLYSIDGTEVWPGFIKTAVDAGPLSDVDRKLLVAAVRAHAQTGLTIQTHTGDNWLAVQEILSILRLENVHPSAWIWVHAHHVRGVECVAEAAEQGAWISFDALNEESAPHILGLVQGMKERGHLGNVLLSHDGDSYMNGQSRPYHFLFTDFIPTLERNGFTRQEIEQLTVANPRRAFALQVRMAH